MKVWIVCYEVKQRSTHVLVFAASAVSAKAAARKHAYTARQEASAFDARELTSGKPGVCEYMSDAWAKSGPR